ncbi:MAG: hypothetical protein AAB425_03305 [Bdellovibrionota bacterium]
MKKISLSILLLSLITVPAYAIPTKVGNGDNGDDLEDLTPITTGPVFESRQRAVTLVKKLDLEFVRGLGFLAAEVETTKMFMASKDVSGVLDLAVAHPTSPTGALYARTRPEPHAITRFYPVCAGLADAQLVALHIHEALHRSLPEILRENESAVMEITLAIVAEDATQDGVRQVLDRWSRELASNPVYLALPSRDTFRFRYGYTQFFGRSLELNDLYWDRRHRFELTNQAFGKQTAIGEFRLAPRMSFLALESIKADGEHDSMRAGPMDLEMAATLHPYDQYFLLGGSVRREFLFFSDAGVDESLFRRAATELKTWVSYDRFPWDSRVGVFLIPGVRTAYGNYGAEFGTAGGLEVDSGVRIGSNRYGLHAKAQRIGQLIRVRPSGAAVVAAATVVTLGPRFEWGFGPWVLEIAGEAALTRATTEALGSLTETGLRPAQIEISLAYRVF